MNIGVYSLCWKNINPKLIELHKKVMSKFDIEIKYTHQNIDHGEWVNYILNTEKSDIFLFVDVDCLLLSRGVFEESIKYISDGYMIGNAQVTNCIPAKHDLFCAPSYIGLSREYYESIGRPDARNNSHSDICQELTRSAVAREKRIKMYFPTSFQSVPSGGVWRLSSYGYYGVGTIFQNKTYHLFQSRFENNIILLEQTANYILLDRINQIQKKYCSTDEQFGKLLIEDDYGH